MDIEFNRKLPFNEELIKGDIVDYFRRLVKEIEDMYEQITTQFTRGVNQVSMDSTVPTAANDPGTKGQIEWDDTYIYLCTDTNTWITFKKDASFKP
jgi:hypothetical protein